MIDFPQVTVHGSCVEMSGNAVLVRGASGSGKSSLCLQLMGFGARLIADDRTVLTCKNGVVIGSAPTALSGLIEARGMGLLHAAPAPPTPVACVIDLDVTETERMPVPSNTHVLGVTLPCFHKVASPAFPAAIIQYLKGGLLREA